MSSPEERLVFVDLETSGLGPDDRIIQIAAIAVGANFSERETFEVKIEFNYALAKAWDFPHRFDVATWNRESLPAVTAAHSFARFLKRHSTIDLMSRTGRPYQVAQLVAHNAERFDAPMLQAWYEKLGIFLPARYMALCTKQKALWLFEEDKSLTPPANFKLGTLCQYFGVRLTENEAHDALIDVRATVALYREMRLHERRVRNREGNAYDAAA